MSNWKYKLKSGRALRNAINDNDYRGTLTQLRNCWKEIHEQFPDDFDEDELEDLYDDINNALDNVQNANEYDLSEEDIEDEINYFLNDLYDFCDALKIWIKL